MNKRKRITIRILFCILLGIGIFCLGFHLRYRSEEWIIHTDEGREIYGCLYRPRFAGSTYPLVILGHGYGGSYSDNLDYGRYLAEHGIACYVFDFCGGSDESKSTNVDMTLWTEMEDMNSIVDHMMDQSWLDNEGLYLAGKSLGGSVAALIAAERPEDVDGLILHYPFFVISDAFRENDSITEEYIIPEVFEQIAKFEGPVVIFNGDKDKYVPLEYSKQAKENYRNAKLFVIEGAGHGFSGSNRNFVKQQMEQFIKEG